MTEGARVALSWAAHFYNLGLNADMDLSVIGLVTVSSTDKHPHEYPQKGFKGTFKALFLPWAYQGSQIKLRHGEKGQRKTARRRLNCVY